MTCKTRAWPQRGWCEGAKCHRIAESRAPGAAWQLGNTAGLLSPRVLHINERSQILNAVYGSQCENASAQQVLRLSGDVEVWSGPPNALVYLDLLLYIPGGRLGSGTFAAAAAAPRLCSPTSVPLKQDFFTAGIMPISSMSFSFKLFDSVLLIAVSVSQAFSDPLFLGTAFFNVFCCIAVGALSLLGTILV